MTSRFKAACQAFFAELRRSTKPSLPPESTAAELAAANERLELTQTAAGLTTWEWDLVRDEMIWTSGRPNLAVLSGKPVMSYRDVVAAVHPDDQTRTLDAAYQAVREKSTFQAEFRVPLPNGAERWVYSRGRVFCDEGGQPRRMLGVNMDITERKVAALALDEEREKFRAIFDQMAVGIVFVAVDGPLVLVNRKITAMFGYDAAECVGKHFLELIHPDDREAVKTAWARFLAREVPDYSVERHFVRKDGTGFWGELTISTVSLANYRTRLGVGVVKDVDQRVKAERAVQRAVAEMKAAMDAADAANNAKSEFLANMSHEIRTPLTAIVGFAELLRPQTSEADRLHHTEIILRNARVLNQLVSDILDLSKIEAGGLVLTPGNVSLAPLVADVRESFEVQAKSKGLAFTVRSGDRLPDEIQTDAARLRQVLVNLLSNALKFTARGGVELAIDRTRDGRDLTFTVSDTGIGIDAEQQTRLFQAFSQADASTTRQFGGSGLGLMLARRLARRLGGDLVLTRSAPGQGSTFVLTIPVERPEFPVDELSRGALAARGVDAEGLLRGVSVLLVEDTPDSQLLLTQFLVFGGADVELAVDGEEAVQKACAKSYDLIVMDVQLPRVDGLEATRRLRREKYAGIIVALTAHAMTQDRKSCLEAGCNAYVSKPVGMVELVRQLAALLGRA